MKFPPIRCVHQDAKMSSIQDIEGVLRSKLEKFGMKKR